VRHIDTDRDKMSHFIWGVEMAISVRLDDDLVKDAKVYADASKRSVPKQIEHWAEIGRIAEDNPDLPYEFIREAVQATAEVMAGKVTRYVRGERD
jgi:hypothetical protein